MARLALVAALAACASPPAEAPAPAPTPTPASVQPAVAAATFHPRHACARKTASFIAVMPGRLDVEIFVSQDNAALAAAARDVDEALRPIAAAAGGKLGVQIIDASTYAGRTLAEQQGIAPENGLADPPGFFGMVVRNGDAKRVVAALSPDHVAIFASAFSRWARRVGADVETNAPSIGVMGGREGFAPPVRAALDDLPYPVDDVDPSRAIDARLRTLLLCHDAQLDDAALHRLDAHVMRGGRLAVLASSVHATDTQATARDAPIARLLAAYGVLQQRGVILDPELAYELTLPASTELRRIPAIPIVQTGLHHAFAPFAGLRALAFPFASPLSVEPQRQPGARLRVVAMTSSASTAHHSASLDLDAALPQSSDRGPFPVAVAVEGVLGSAFGPARSRDTRLFVAASPFVVDPLSDPPDVDRQVLARGYAQRHLTHTALALEGVLEWLQGDEAAACRAVAAAHADHRARQRPFQRCAPAQVRTLLDQSRDVDHVLDVCGGFEDPL